MTDAGLSVIGARLRLGGKNILDGTSMAALPGRLNGLIGPNGAGKSSLLRFILGLERQGEGIVRFAGEDLHAMPPQRRARIAALVEQSAATDLQIDAESVVDLGRIPHLGFWATGASLEDRAIAKETLQLVGMDGFARRPYATLSGGEQQKLQIARALAQQPQLLLLDEPTNHLDIEAQLAVLRLLEKRAEAGLTVLLAIHDLNLAAAFLHHLVVLDRGRVVAEGAPAEILTRELLAEVYRVDAEIFAHPATGRPMIAYRGARPGRREFRDAPAAEAH